MRAELQRPGRKRFLECRLEDGNYLWIENRGVADSEAGRRAPGSPTCSLHRAVRLEQRLACPCEKGPARRRQPRALRAPREQRHAEITFQLLDLATQRRLRHVQPVGSRAKAALFSYRNEAFQLAQVDSQPHAEKVSRNRSWPHLSFATYDYYVASFEAVTVK